MENIAAIREALRAGRDIPLIVKCDNAWNFNERFDYVIWDDDNERVFVFRPNDITELSMKCPLMLTVTAYEHIQKMEVVFTADALEDVIDAASTLYTISDDQKLAIMKGLAPVTRLYGDKVNKQKAAIAAAASSEDDSTTDDSGE